MRTPSSENQAAIALLTKDQLWDMLAEAERNHDETHAELARQMKALAEVKIQCGNLRQIYNEAEAAYAEKKSMVEHLRRELKREQEKRASPIELTVQRPLRSWPSDLLYWIFWSEELTKMDPADYAVEMIHAEMNARGEGERVAV